MVRVQRLLVLAVVPTMLKHRVLFRLTDFPASPQQRVHLASSSSMQDERDRSCTARCIAWGYASASSHACEVTTMIGSRVRPELVPEGDDHLHNIPTSLSCSHEETAIFDGLTHPGIKLFNICVHYISLIIYINKNIFHNLRIQNIYYFYKKYFCIAHCIEIFNL